MVQVVVVQTTEFDALVQNATKSGCLSYYSSSEPIRIERSVNIRFMDYSGIRFIEAKDSGADYILALILKAKEEGIINDWRT
jgi:hypothetical protein